VPLRYGWIGEQRSVPMAWYYLLTPVAFRPAGAITRFLDLRGSHLLPAIIFWPTRRA
jgi:hypothetical protein